MANITIKKFQLTVWAEECPVCHSKLYLNRNMRFLISTECYHKMCKSCVERLLARGPIKCPISGCKATLRRHKFRAPTFADLKLEKEVDIRRNMSKTYVTILAIYEELGRTYAVASFNRREDEFENLRAYNDYLGMVEDLTFNLINDFDVEDTRRKIDAYKQQNDRAIEQNREIEEEGAKAFEEYQKAEKEAATRKRLAARQEEEEERREQQAAEQDYLAKLAAGEDAETLAQQRALRLQKAADRRKAAVDSLSDETQDQSTFLRGLKRRAKEEPEAPYDPFGGYSEKKDYFVVFDDYPIDRTFDDFKKKPRVNAGGYDPHEYYRRALCDAFSGLRVFVSEELARTDTDMTSEMAEVSTSTAVT